MKIIKDNLNYTKIKTIQFTCNKCKSVIEIEKRDLEHHGFIAKDNYAVGQHICYCPLCNEPKIFSALELCDKL